MGRHRHVVDGAAEAGDLAGEGGEAVGLVAAQVRDAVQVGRALGQRGDGRDDGGQLADVVQVDADNIEDLATFMKDNSSRIAAVLIEPLQVVMYAVQELTQFEDLLRIHS